MRKYSNMHKSNHVKVPMITDGYPCNHRCEKHKGYQTMQFGIHVCASQIAGSQTLQNKVFPHPRPVNLTFWHTRMRIANRGDQQVGIVTWTWEAPKLCKRQCFPTVDPASYILACTYAHRKSQGPTGRNCNTAMGRFPNPAKHSVSDPASYILWHMRVRIATRELKKPGRNCNMAMGGLPNPAKHSVSLYPKPCILHFGNTRMRIAHRIDEYI